jgi:hypothetical protein
VRAELFSLDFLISLLVFLAAFIVIVAYYQNLQTDISETNTRNNMYSKAISIASLLATTNGYPQYWDNSTVEVIGLYDNGKFNLTKFEYLINNTTDYPPTYQNIKTMLGTGAYELNITLINATGNILQKPNSQTYFYTYGTSPSNANQIVLIKRLGVVKPWGGSSANATKVVLEVILWE